MIRFMICDTDTEFAARLARMLHNWFDPCSVEHLYGPSALEVSLRMDSGGADILFAEIELRDRSAIDIVAENLQDSSPVQIIYLTSRMEFCTDVYRTRHSGFLVKPVRIDALKQSVQWALQMYENRKREGVVVQRGSQIHIVLPQSLLFVESSSRMLTVVTDTEKLEVYGKLTDFATRLDKRFVHCHKSYLVNMERVQRYCGEYFLMENGTSVPISQSRRKTIREAFMRFANAALQDSMRNF